MANAIAMEGIGWRKHRRGPRIHRALECGVGVIDEEFENRARSAELQGRTSPHVRCRHDLVGQQHVGAARKFQLCAAIEDLGCERALVEIDGLLDSTDDQVRRYCAVAGGPGTLNGHGVLLSAHRAG